MAEGEPPEQLLTAIGNLHENERRWRLFAQRVRELRARADTEGAGLRRSRLL